MQKDFTEEISRSRFALVSSITRLVRSVINRSHSLLRDDIVRYKLEHFVICFKYWIVFTYFYRNGFGAQKRNFDEINRSSFGFNKKNFDEINRSSFGFNKRNFDEINRSSFGFNKRNFDEINRSSFGFNKRNFDEINRSSFGFNKRNFDEINRSSFGFQSNQNYRPKAIRRSQAMPTSSTFSYFFPFFKRSDPVEKRNFDEISRSYFGFSG